MIFPAQTIMITEPVELPLPQQTQYGKTVHSKYNSLKEKGQPKINIFKQYRPINLEMYNQLKDKLKEIAAKAKEDDPQSIDEFLPIILGTIQGRSGNEDDTMGILIEEFGQNIDKLKIEDPIRLKTKPVSYGFDKRREMTIRECDKKSLESLGELYDIKNIKSHRKFCSSVKNYMKSYKKFMISVQKCSQTITDSSQVYQNYIEYMKDQYQFNKIKLANEQQLEPMTEEKEKVLLKTTQGIQIHVTPLKQHKNRNSKKDETTQSNKNIQKEENNKEGVSNQKAKTTRIRKSKEEVQKERLMKEQQKQTKRKEKEQKEKEKLMQKQREKAEKAEKQRLKQLQKQEKQRERKAKQEQKQAKEREKQREKEAERRKKQQEKEKKSNFGSSLYTWFKPKAENQNGSPSKKTISNEENNQKSPLKSQLQKQKDDFLQLISQQSTPSAVCKGQFFQNRMKDQNNRFQPIYISIFTHKSRLQFNNYMITEQNVSDYTQPHQQIDNGKYDDSSVEYEDFCGDMCSEQNDVMSVEEQVQEEENEQNSAIVPDNYLSGDELSSGAESNDDIVINIDGGSEWSFTDPSHHLAQNFGMYCLYDEPMPLELNQAEQSNEISVSTKCELYKEIHGFCGIKDTLIKKLVLITDKIPKSYLDSLLRQTTTKKANQRLVKPEIIDFLNEQKEGFAKQLQEIKEKRDIEIALEARQKVSEKEKEIQRLILEEAGTYYIIDLLQFLREKGFKMSKKDLKSFIDARVGSHWDDIRRRMQKMQLKPKERITNFVRKQKSDQDKEDKDKGGKGPAAGQNVSQMKPQ